MHESVGCRPFLGWSSICSVTTHQIAVIMNQKKMKSKTLVTRDRYARVSRKPILKANDEEIFKDATQAVIGEHIAYSMWTELQSVAR